MPAAAAVWNQDDRNVETGESDYLSGNAAEVLCLFICLRRLPTVATYGCLFFIFLFYLMINNFIIILFHSHSLIMILAFITPIVSVSNESFLRVIARLKPFDLGLP